jgi:hypothetical protein
MKKMFLLFGLLAMVGILFVACTDEQATAPPEPVEETGEMDFSFTFSGCEALFETTTPENKARALFRVFDGQITAVSLVRQVRRNARYGRYDRAANKAWQLAELVQAKLPNRLVDPCGSGPPTTEEGAAMLMNEVFALAQVELPVGGIPPAALGPEGTVAVVEPGVAADVVTPDLHAAAIVEETSFEGTRPVTIIITPTLKTTLGEYEVLGTLYDIWASEELAEGEEVVIEMCVPNILPVPFSWVSIGHDTGDGIEALPRVTDGLTVQCGDAFPEDLASAGSLTRSIGQSLKAMFAPKPLHAAFFAGTGLGGRTKSFSDFAPINAVGDVPVLSAPPDDFVVPQNNDAVADTCDVHPNRGIGYEMNFAWSYGGVARTFDLRAENVGAALPIVNTTVIGLTYRHVSCNSFVAAQNLEADWEWKARVHTIDGSAPWSPANKFTWEACILDTGAPCTAVN